MHHYARHTNSSKAVRIINIIDFTAAKHETCHRIFINASKYMLYFIPIGFQIYACNVIVKHSMLFEITLNTFQTSNFVAHIGKVKTTVVIWVGICRKFLF